MGGSGGPGAVRWEQGTCNASFRDEAQKLNQQKYCEASGKKVSLILWIAISYMDATVI